MPSQSSISYISCFKGRFEEVHCVIFFFFLHCQSFCHLLKTSSPCCNSQPCSSRTASRIQVIISLLFSLAYCNVFFKRQLTLPLRTQIFYTISLVEVVSSSVLFNDGSTEAAMWIIYLISKYCHIYTWKTLKKIKLIKKTHINCFCNKAIKKSRLSSTVGNFLNKIKPKLPFAGNKVRAISCDLIRNGGG